MTTKVKTGATTGVTSPVEANVTVSAIALINGEQRSSGQTLEIRDPYRGDVVGTMDISSTADLDDALEAAVQTRDMAAAMPGYERAALLLRPVARASAPGASDRPIARPGRAAGAETLALSRGAN